MAQKFPPQSKNPLDTLRRMTMAHWSFDIMADREATRCARATDR